MTSPTGALATSLMVLVCLGCSQLTAASEFLHWTYSWCDGPECQTNATTTCHSASGNMGQCHTTTKTTSVAMSCEQSTDFCVMQDVYTSMEGCSNQSAASNNASSLVHTGAAVCDRCSTNPRTPIDAPSNKTYMTLRHCQTPNPVLSTGCNNDCSVCDEDTELKHNACVAVGTEGIQLGDAYPCGGVAKVSIFSDSGDCTTTAADAVNVAYSQVDSCVQYHKQTKNGADRWLSLRTSCPRKAPAGGSPPPVPWLEFRVVEQFGAEYPKSAVSVYNNEILLELEWFAEFLKLSEINSVSGKTTESYLDDVNRTCDVTAAFILPDGTLLAPLLANGSLPSGMLIAKPGEPLSALNKLFLDAGKYMNVTVVNGPPLYAYLEWSFALVCADLPTSFSTTEDFFPKIHLESQSWVEREIAMPFATEWANGESAAYKKKFHNAFRFITNLTTNVFYPKNMSSVQPSAPSPSNDAAGDGLRKLSTGAVVGIVIAIIIVVVCAVVVVRSRTEKTATAEEQEPLSYT